MNGDNDEQQNKAETSKEDERAEEKKGKEKDDSRFSYIESSKTGHDERKGLKVLPKSDLKSLRKKHDIKMPHVLKIPKEPENNSEEGESTGKHGRQHDHEKGTAWDRVDRIEAEHEHRRLHHAPSLMDTNIFSEVMGIMRAIVSDFAKFRLEIKNRFNDLSKRNETLIFSMLKTGLHTIADVERTEGGGIRVIRPPKDMKDNVTEDDDGRVTKFTVALDHEFNICATCGDEIKADSEFYVMYDHAMKGNTIRVFDTDACRSLWVKANRSIGLGWSDDVATIRNLAYGYATTGIADYKKEYICDFIDWIAEGAIHKDSQQSLIIGPENRGSRSKEIRWADEGAKSLEDYATEFMKSTDPDVFPIRVEWNNASVYRNAITEFIKFVKDELKKDTAAEEKS